MFWIWNSNQKKGDLLDEDIYDGADGDALKVLEGSSNINSSTTAKVADQKLTV